MSGGISWLRHAVFYGTIVILSLTLSSLSVKAQFLISGEEAAKRIEQFLSGEDNQESDVRQTNADTNLRPNNQTQQTPAPLRKPTPPKDAPPSPYQREMTRGYVKANTGKIRILTKGFNDTSTHIVSDMSNVLNDMGRLRVIPVVGNGSLQGVADLLYLKGIDLSIVQSDVLAYIKRKKIHSNIQKRVRYITKLHHSELHLIAAHGIHSIQDLQDKKVNFGKKDQGAFISANVILDSLGIKVQTVYLPYNEAIAKLKNGEIAASFIITGKPAIPLRLLKKHNGLHFLPIEYSDALVGSYLPAELTHDDYPDMIGQDETVPTIAVSEVLAIFNWDPKNKRYKDMQKFIDALFKKYGDFLKPGRHEKWQQINLAATVPGWKRFGAAQVKLQKAKVKKQGTQQAYFYQFLQKMSKNGKNLPEAKKKDLYKKYTEWLKKNQTQ